MMSSMYNKKQIGSWGEKIAYYYLQQNDYKIIETNFKCKLGEIDIIAWDNLNKELVFVEVKTRTNYNYGEPAEAVNYQKKKHILKTSQYYLYIKNIFECYIRYDVIEVMYQYGKAKLNHLKDVDIHSK